MRAALVAATVLLLAAPVVAQDDRKATVEAVLDKAIAEHTIFLNCTATERDSYDLVIKGWQADVLAAVPLLAENGFTGEEIAAFTTRAAIDALLMKDRPFGEIIDYCMSQGDWIRALYEMRYTVLPLAIRKELDR